MKPGYGKLRDIYDHVSSLIYNILNGMIFKMEITNTIDHLINRSAKICTTKCIVLKLANS